MLLGYGNMCSINGQVLKLVLMYIEEEFDGGLSLSSNNLGGTIPHEVVFLDKLEWLILWGSYVGGTIPNELSKLRLLEHCQLNWAF